MHTNTGEERKICAVFLVFHYQMRFGTKAQKRGRGAGITTSCHIVMQKSLSLPTDWKPSSRMKKKNVYEHKKEMQDTLNFIKKFERKE